MSDFTSAEDFLKFYNSSTNFDFEYQSLDFIKFNENTIEIQDKHRWRYRGYTYGQGLASPDRKYFFLKIPKNGSSFASTHLSKLGWEYKQLDECPDSQIIGVLRDPIERWISGIVEYLFMYHMEDLDYISYPWDYEYEPILGERLGLSIIFNQMTFDDHTERQASFFRNIDLSAVKYFFLDEKFNHNFAQYINDIGYPNDIEEAEKINSTDEDGDHVMMYKKSLKNTITKIVNRSPYKKYNLKQWHWCDYELIRRVNENIIGV